MAVWLRVSAKPIQNMSYMMKTAKLLTASFMDLLRSPRAADVAVCVLQTLNPLPSTAKT